MTGSNERVRGRFFKRRPSQQRETTVPEPAPRDASESVPFGMRLAAAWSWRLLLVGGVLAVIVFLIIQLRLIVIPILVAVLLGALLVPFSQFLQRHRWPRWLAITVAMLSALAVVGGLLTLGISQIVRGSDELAAQALVAWEEFSVWLLEGPLHITEAQLNGWVDQLLQAAQQDSGILVSGVLSVGTSLGHFLAGMLLALFATLFILIDGRGIWRWIVGVFPRRARAAVDGAGTAGWATLRNFVKVQILVATIDAIGIGLGAFLLGLPLAVPIAILVFLGSFIPIVGAFVTGALAVFVALIYNG
ncbi:MAG TPA: AI-2E family transporter, partial [Agromyces sp.]|nr:AI-2E family transporter [Agromyces sp.]